MKIAEVSLKTGVSRELIHHYLRQGLLPKSTSRARYSEQQIRLLRQIKTLREDHHLPLEIIRGVFDYFDFEPGHIEALTEADSLSRRMTRLANAGDVLSNRTVTTEQLLRQVQITAERLDEYVEARLVSPMRTDNTERYSVYDAKVISLCEHGIRMGMPFESLRTVGSYVRVAYELEHPDLLYLAPDPDAGPNRLMGEVIARLEVITSFIQSLLQSLLSRHVLDFHAPPGRQESLDAVIYRPSPSFLRRHQLDRHQEEAAQLLSESPGEADGWLSTAQLLIHAGRYNEAVFFLEKGLERLEDGSVLGPPYGRALLLAGHHAKAAEQLARYSDEPLCAVYRVLLRYAAADTAEALDVQPPDAVHCVRLLDEALARVQDVPAETRYEVQLLAGWLLTALPKAFRDADRGLALLVETLAALQADATAGAGLPGLRERHLINAAFLLFDAQAHHAPAVGADRPSAEALRTLVCRLDPGCAFAEAVYLQQDACPQESP